MKVKPWYKVMTPREDLRAGKPLDAAEFAVHLDHVRDGRAADDYQDPECFFERTYLTSNLVDLASQVIRRLSGETTETSAVFNMATQFGGGKTHALTLLYHLARKGAAAARWVGVRTLLNAAGISDISKAETAVFVGTEFDSLRGRGGDDGTPLRRTPWGEIAFQLGGAEAFSIVEQHDREGIAPAGDVIRSFLPRGPALILMDELMNYVSRCRKRGFSDHIYEFLQNLSETARGQHNIVLVVSIPASELEMTVDDQSDYSRLKKLLDRLGKPIVMSADTEASEIIRRRLFEWDLNTVTSDGRVVLPRDAISACNEYSRLISDNGQLIPPWFPVDDAQGQFASSYPFHPSVLSVFERKWRALPRFQQTRGILRLLAQWVAKAYQSGSQGVHRDSLIGLGSAPLEDPIFRRAMFEQLGEDRLEGAVTTDIIGKPDSFAVRLDSEANDIIRKHRLHQKVATSILFESSGGQQHKEASLPEIRMAVAEPGMDLGNVEIILDELASDCYFLTVHKNRYMFSLTPNLNKLLSDRKSAIKQKRIEESVREETKKIFLHKTKIDNIYFFPEKSNQVPDRPHISFVVLSLERTILDDGTTTFIDQLTKEFGSSPRIFKSALIWIIPELPNSLLDDARTFLAWEDIDTDDSEHFDDIQKHHLSINYKKAIRNFQEAIWRTYKNIALLGRDNNVKIIDLGLVHSSAADSITDLIFNNLRQIDEIADDIVPSLLVRNWPPAITKWSTQEVRNAFFASPKFPRLINANKLKETISKGVADGVIAYAAETSDGRLDPFIFKSQIGSHKVEFANNVFILTSNEAKKYIKPPALEYLEINPKNAQIQPGESLALTVRGFDQFGQNFTIDTVSWGATGGRINGSGVFRAAGNEGEFTITATSGDVESTVRVVVSKEDGARRSTMIPGTVRWSNEIPPHKWVHYYTQVLSKLVNAGDVKICVDVEASPKSGITQGQIEEIEIALKQYGIDIKVKVFR